MDIHAKIMKHFVSFGYRTDHSFIGVEINLEESNRGKGFWKFNTSLLKDKEYVRTVKAAIKKTIEQYTRVINNNETVRTLSNQMLFEMIKLNIRGVTIPYCPTLKEKRKKFRV